MSNTYQIYLISDSTGETLDRIFIAIKAQFKNIKYNIHTYSFTRTNNQISKILSGAEKNNNSIILYMKGTKEMPMCGFSNSVVQILNHYGISYKDINVLEDPNIRIKLSEHSGWPTIPQLFVKGELIGGADIATELHQNGQLLDILDKANS